MMRNVNWGLFGRGVLALLLVAGLFFGLVWGVRWLHNKFWGAEVSIEEPAFSEPEPEPDPEPEPEPEPDPEPEPEEEEEWQSAPLPEPTVLISTVGLVEVDGQQFIVAHIKSPGDWIFHWECLETELIVSDSMTGEEEVAGDIEMLLPPVEGKIVPVLIHGNKKYKGVPILP